MRRVQVYVHAPPGCSFPEAVPGPEGPETSLHLESTGLATLNAALPVFVTVNVYVSFQPSALARTGLSAAVLTTRIPGA